MHDLAIRNARIHDGASRHGALGDLGIVNGLVAEVGDVGPALTDIDVRGSIASPGFIDSHTHDDAEMFKNPLNPSKLLQGVTTVVTGNCGFSAFPNRPGRASPDLLRSDGPWTTYEGYRRTLEARGIGTNVAALVGHNTAQRVATGVVHRRATPQELSKVKDAVRTSMKHGALGMSTGLIYEPGRYCETEDLIEIASVVGEFGGIYSTHLRDEAEGLEDSVAEAIRIARSAGTSLQLSHLKVIGPDNWGSIGPVLDRITLASSEGVAVGLDLYPYTAGSGPLQTYFDPSSVDLVRAALVQIVHSPDFPEYGGQRLADIAAKQERTLEDVTVELITSPRSRETICIIFEINEADIREVLLHPLATIGSDGIPLSHGVPHPRLTDTFPRILGNYTRDLGLFDLDEALSKMTWRTADHYGLKNRGRLTPGSAADIVIFDLDRIAEGGTFERRGSPRGIEYVIVNGQIAVDPDGVSGRLAGQVLLKSARP